MPTPITEDIRKKAWELYFADNPDFASDVVVPEDHELKEEGYWLSARNTLMGTAKLDSLVQEEVKAVDEIAEAAEIAALREKQQGINEQIDKEIAAPLTKKEETLQEPSTNVQEKEKITNITEITPIKKEYVAEKILKESSAPTEKEIIKVQILEEKAAETPAKDIPPEITAEEAAALSINDICCEACVYAASDVKLCKCKCGGVFHGKGNSHKGEDEKTLIQNLINDEKENPSKEKKPKAKKALAPHIASDSSGEGSSGKEKIEKAKKMETTSRKRPVRTRIPTETNTLQAANSNLIALFSEITETLRKGIDVGNTNMPQGLLSLMLLTDILHGGAYAAPINQLPFYISDKSKSPYYAGPDTKNFIPLNGITGLLLNLFGTENASFLMAEIMENSNVPHVFPKIISDQTFAEFKMIMSWLTTQSIFTQGVTNVTSLVKTGGEYVKNVGQGVKAMEEGAAAQTKAATEALTALLPLVAGA